MDFQDLLAPFDDDLDIDEALTSWRWLVSGAMRAIAMTATGDLFMQRDDGCVLRLDTMGGTCEPVAGSLPEWKAMLRDPETLDRWFVPAFVAELRRTAELQRGQCYSPVHPPFLNGPYTVENWPPTPWEEHFRVMGSLHEQIKDLPDGTPITKLHYTRL